MDEPIRITFSSTIRGKSTVRIEASRLPQEIPFAELRKSILGLLEEKQVSFELSLRNLHTFDSTTLGMLVTTYMSIIAQGGTARVLVDEGSQIHDKLRLTKLDLVLPLVFDEDE